MNEWGARLFDGKREKQVKHLTEGDVEKFGHDKGSPQVFQYSCNSFNYST